MIGMRIMIASSLIAVLSMSHGCAGDQEMRIIGEKGRQTKEKNQVKMLAIKWQRLVYDGQTCPRCGSTEEYLQEAVSALKRSLTPLGIEVVLEKAELSLAEFKERPLDSNQIWINDRPLDDWLGGGVGRSPCCDVCGPSDCRTLDVGGRTFEAIPADLVVRAGLLAASQLLGEKADRPCRAAEPPTPSRVKCCPK